MQNKTLRRHLEGRWISLRAEQGVSGGRSRCYPYENFSEQGDSSPCVEGCSGVIVGVGACMCVLL